MTDFAELIVQAFVKDILALLADRFECDFKDGNVRKAIFLKPFEEDEASGLAGLDYGTVEVLLPRKPNISLAKAAARHANSHFEQNKIGLWHDKLMDLFLWDDNPTSSDDKRRGWENQPFRRLARLLHSLVRREYDDETDENFLDVLRTVASLKIWIILQYDIGEISRLRKASPKNDRDTGEAIESLSELDRTNWLMPQLPAGHFETFQLVDHDFLRMLERFRAGRNSGSKYRGQISTLPLNVAVCTRLAVAAPPPPVLAEMTFVIITT